jgi:type II secretory pathway component PulF
MANYRYKARDQYGKAVLGLIEAPSMDAAGGRLSELGYIPISLIELKKRKFALPKPLTALQKIKPDDIIMFNYQFATLIGAGISILNALQTLSVQTKNKKLKEILEQAGTAIEEGSSLSEALARHPSVFPEISVNMIRAGEVSGRLEEIFLRLAHLAEHETETKNRLKAATRYPKMVLFTLTIALIIMLVFVIPRFALMFSRFKIALPLPTRILIGLNHYIQNYWYIILVFILIPVILFQIYIRTPQGRFRWDFIKIRVPILGPIFLKIAMSRFTHIMGTLNRSGVPFIENLAITAKTIGNEVISRAVDKIREGVQQGKGLAAPMKETNLFTPMVIQMVSVGETSGTMDEVLLKVTEFYDREVEYGTKNLSSLVEPILIFCLGLIIIFFALAIFLPLWELTAIARR